MARGVKRTSIETKVCERCANDFPRNRKYSDVQWQSVRWCSRRCGAWNAGLTKQDDPRLLATSERMRGVATGRQGWSKGLTKRTHPSLAIVSRKVSATQKGRPCTEMQRAAMSAGRTWAKGRTSATCPIIAAGAVKRADKMRGVKRPDQSVRCKVLFSLHPEKHPNAILARKTKGRGHTYIEKIVSDILTELGVAFDFNINVGNKWPDFSIPSRHLIVEADGEHWHQDAEKEARRDAHLQSLGWRVLHLSGKALVNDTAGCRTKIIAALAENCAA